MADALTYAHADDIEQAWIDHVTAGVEARDDQRRRWLVENIASGLGVKDLTWKTTDQKKDC